MEDFIDVTASDEARPKCQSLVSEVAAPAHLALRCHNSPMCRALGPLRRSVLHHHVAYVAAPILTGP